MYRKNGMAVGWRHPGQNQNDAWVIRDHGSKNDFRMGGVLG